MHKLLELLGSNALNLRSVLSTMVAVLMMSGCNQPELVLPPLTQKGDASLTVTVQLSGKGQFPTGSQMIITLADISRQGADSLALAGDVVTLSQPDRAVRISIPIDSNKITVCRSKNVCGVSVKVVRGTSILYQSNKFVPYVTGQPSISVAVRGT